MAYYFINNRSNDSESSSFFDVNESVSESTDNDSSSITYVETTEDSDSTDEQNTHERKNLSDDNRPYNILDFSEGIIPENFMMNSLIAVPFTNSLGSNLSDDHHTDVSRSWGAIIANQEDNRLSLAFERLQLVPKIFVERFGPEAEIVDVSHNKLRDLDFIKKFRRLTSLIADDNLIDETTILPHSPNLELLWLNNCKIKTLYPWIKKLQQSCPKLKHLCMMGNLAAPSYLNGGTFYEYLQYRLFVISLFPNLMHLDDRAVTVDQRSEAERLYKRPLLERIFSSNHPDPVSIVFDRGTSFSLRTINQTVLRQLGSRSKSPLPRRNLLI